MKKTWGWIVGGVLVVGLVFYIFWSNMTSAPVATNTTPADNTDNGGNGQPASDTTGGTGTDTGTGSTPTPTSTDMPGMNMGTYKDGTYTGPVADAVYGQLQVTVTISGGMITNVSWPVYPNSPGHTTDVSASSLPKLKQEAIASQSADVNVISGATQTSEAFQQSLAAALVKAQS